MSDGLTHIGPDGRPRMVDISQKSVTERIAIASGRIRMKPETLTLALGGNVKKGDVQSVSELAGIMGAKRTSDLIPLCHPLPLSGVNLTIEPDKELPGFEVIARVKTTGKTGVEMEALTAVSVACLTLYDMLKAADKGMSIEQVELIEKSGGRSGHYKKSEER